MSERHSPLKARGQGLLGDVAKSGEAWVRGVVGEVSMHINGGVEVLGQLEDHIDVPLGVLRRRLVVRTPTDDRRSGEHCLIHERQDPWGPDDAFLRKGHNLEVEEVPIILGEHEGCLHPHQALDVVDVWLSTSSDGPVAQGHVEHHPRALHDVLSLLLRLESARDSTRIASLRVPSRAG
ncbi:MAG: hypothetical protein M3Y91_11380 [Actinomycetota bacterium]|nr:hypothetical protein [Actinomycetota bacterium]